MRKYTFYTVFAYFIASVGFYTHPAQARLSKVDHIIIVIQENRTPDNLFQGLQNIMPGADIATSGVNSKGQVIPLQPLPLDTGFDIGHHHSDFSAMYDRGKMDGADREQCDPAATKCPANPAFHYVQHADVIPYFSIAQNYGFANRMFQSNQGPSYPAHQFLFSGTSQPFANFSLFVSENPIKSNESAGCTAPPDQTVFLIDQLGSENYSIYPCFEHQTLADLLEKPPNDPTHALSWRYYGAGPGSIWMAPNAIRHLCVPKGSPLKCSAPEWTGGDIVTRPPQVLTDIRQRALRTVSWVTPSAQYSDHAGINDGTGPSWVASIVNAVGNSPYWQDTVILIVWDDWGGWYDHVVPPIDPTYGYYESGFRVPLLVVSAYTPQGYISNQQHDFGSILRFSEEAFNLGRIPPGNFADSRSDDLSDFFDFTKPARAFIPVPTKVPPSQFLNPAQRMLPPDND